MTALFIGVESHSKFRGLVEVYGGRLVDKELDMRIECENISLGALQPDRFDRSINCYVEINTSRTQFMFQDLAAALETTIDESTSIELSGIPLIERNDQILNNFITFCIEKRNALRAWPPAWFPLASEYSLVRFFQNFPTLAEQTRLEHMRLWETWSKL